MKRIAFLTLLLLVFTYLDMDAQCAMCKENVASSQEAAANGDLSASFGSGLNNGILFLMAIPYVFIMSIIWIVFKKRIKAFFLSKFSRA